MSGGSATFSEKGIAAGSTAVVDPSRFSGVPFFCAGTRTHRDFSLAPVLPYSGASVTVTCFSGSTTAWSSFPCNAAANSYEGVHGTFRMTAMP